MRSFLAFRYFFGAICIAFLAPALQAAQLASSQFNNPPFTAGITVDGQGGSESGWAAPWLKLGGFSDRGIVVNNPTQEGNGAVQIFASATLGTSVEREWLTISPVVRVDAYVNVTPGASMDGQIVTATPASGEIDPRRAGTWKNRQQRFGQCFRHHNEWLSFNAIPHDSDAMG